MEHLAAEFLRANIEPGDKVGLLCLNGPDYVIGSFALFLIDAVVVPIFPGLKLLEIADLDAALRLDGVCSTSYFHDSLSQKFRRAPLKINFSETEITFYIQKLHRDNRDVRSIDKPWGNEAPLIRFTSGTTSKARGVIIPQAAMVEYTHRFAEAYAIQKGDCILNMLSMAHNFYQITAGMLRGAKLVVEGAVNASAIEKLIRRERVTHVEAAPSVYSMGLASGDWHPEVFRHVHYITSCGAPLPDNVAANFHNQFNREIVQRYGLTETGPVLINTDEAVSKRGSLGKAAPNCELRLSANGTESTVGEIQIRCPGLFAGYYSPGR